MNDARRVQKIIDSVKEAYGSLDKPDYTFTESRYRSLLRHPFVVEVMSRYFVKNDTDLDAHAALHLQVLHDSGRAMICLSFVDNWAMVFRLGAERPVYVEVIDFASPVSGAEKDIVNLLQQHKFNLLTKAEAAVRLEMSLFDTDPAETRLYHAIISDDGVVPQVLLR